MNFSTPNKQKRPGNAPRIVALVLLAFFISSCTWFPAGVADPGDDSSGQGAEAAPIDQITGSVPGRSDGSVELRGADSSNDPILFASGDIGPDGKFTIDLTDVVPPAEGLFAMSAWADFALTSFDTVSISDESAQLSFPGNYIPLSVFDEAGASVGQVHLFDGPTITTSVGAGRQVFWIYADRDVTIEGTVDRDSVSIVQEFSMVMLEGWNQLLVRIVEDTVDQLFYDTDADPAGVDWYNL